MDGENTPLLDDDASYNEGEVTGLSKNADPAKKNANSTNESVNLRNMVLFHGKVRNA